MWVGVPGRKWSVELPSIREYDEVSVVVAEEIDRWGAETLEQGIERRIEPGIEQAIEQGNERQRTLLHRLAERLSAVLAGVTDADRLAEAGEWIVDGATTADFLARVSCADS